jgi:ribosome-binding protein aMBF1 (putative translation factor)
MNFRDHLKEEMKNPQFKKAFDEEKHLLELGMVITEAREKLGLSQRELAQKSHVTQQQLSKIENGFNCNLLTLLKVSTALGLDLTLSEALSA